MKWVSISGYKLRMEVQKTQEIEMHQYTEIIKKKLEKANSWAPWPWGRWFQLLGHRGG